MGSEKQRLGYLDWLRGLACLLMFQTHCYDSWLGGAARESAFIRWSRLGGTLPAPMFLFLAGISFALVTDRMRRRAVSADAIAATTIRRGAQIFGLALLFRLQEFLLGYRWAPWTDLLRVDVLNVIGLSLLLMGTLCWIVRSRGANALAAAVAAAVITLATPPLWTTWRPRWLPWYLESYVNGVHTYHSPQSWMFPIFPWAGFAFAGLTVGLLLFCDWSIRNADKASGLVAVFGIAIFLVSLWLDSRPRVYAVSDYWHTSPNFFLARVGVLLLLTSSGYAWCRWGAGELGFSPLAQMGQTSLLVYWVHIEFVYGRFSILAKQMQTIPVATLGLITIFIAMVLVSMLRTRWKTQATALWSWFRRVLAPAAEIQ